MINSLLNVTITVDFTFAFPVKGSYKKVLDEIFDLYQKIGQFNFIISNEKERECLDGSIYANLDGSVRVHFLNPPLVFKFESDTWELV